VIACDGSPKRCGAMPGIDRKSMPLVGPQAQPSSRPQDHGRFAAPDFGPDARKIGSFTLYSRVNMLTSPALKIDRQKGRLIPAFLGGRPITPQMAAPAMGSAASVTPRRSP